MKVFKPFKKLRRKKQHKDYKTKLNILRRWQKEQENRKKDGLPLRKMPVDFPQSKKYENSKKN